MEKVKEIELQKQICEWLNYNKCFAWRTNSGVFFLKNAQGKTRCVRASAKGTSDILGIKPNGQFFAIEVKVGKNKPTSEQEEFLAKILKHGGLAFVAYSLENVIEKMKI